jgi:LacY proton/sugar symporter
MEFTSRETWTLIHGLVLGTFFLVAFGGGLAGLWSLRTEYVTEAGIVERLRRLKLGTAAMAVAAWATVITGTWVVYPWYREALAGEELTGCEGASVPTDECSPRDFLLSNASGQTEDWHKFGMEWKEHIAWISPMLATLAAFLVFYYGPLLARNRTARLLVLVVFVGAFVTAAVAGLFGALITKTAPIT